MLNSGSKGFTLVESMIALGVLSIAALSINSLVTLNVKSISSSQRSSDFNSLVNSAAALVSDDSSCNCALGVKYLPWGTDGDKGDVRVTSSKGTDSKCPNYSNVNFNAGVDASTDIVLRLGSIGANGEVGQGKQYGSLKIQKISLRGASNPVPALDESGHYLQSAVLRIEAAPLSSSGTVLISESAKLTLRLRGSSGTTELLGCTGLRVGNSTSLNLPVCRADQVPISTGTGFTCRTFTCPGGSVPTGVIADDGNVQCTAMPKCAATTMSSTGRLVNEYTKRDTSGNKITDGDVPVPVAPLPIYEASALRYECKILSCPPGRTPVLDKYGYIVGCGAGQVGLACTSHTMECYPSSGTCVLKNFSCDPPPGDVTAPYFCIEDCTKKADQAIAFYLPSVLDDGRSHNAASCVAAGGKVVEQSLAKQFSPAWGIFPPTAPTFTLTRSLVSGSFEPSTKYYCSMLRDAACLVGWDLYGGYLHKAVCTPSCSWGSQCSRGTNFDWGRAGIDRCARSECTETQTTKEGWYDGAAATPETLSCTTGTYIVNADAPSWCSLCYTSGACSYNCGFSSSGVSTVTLSSTIWRVCY